MVNDSWRLVIGHNKFNSTVLRMNDQRTSYGAEDKCLSNNICVIRERSPASRQKTGPMPEMGTGNFYTMQPIQFSESGIQMLLQNLEGNNKSPGLDKIHPLVFKHSL